MCEKAIALGNRSESRKKERNKLTADLHAQFAGAAVRDPVPAIACCKEKKIRAAQCVHPTF